MTCWEGLLKLQGFLWAVPLHLPLLCKHTFQSLLASTQHVTPSAFCIEILELGGQPTRAFSGFSPRKWSTPLFFLPITERPLLEIPKSNSLNPMCRNCLFPPHLLGEMTSFSQYGVKMNISSFFSLFLIPLLNQYRTLSLP